ncbi:MAG: hypothetical protein KJZ78_09370, partial [Bryobacteraceae bacterium]|nr:hypothetical protein [Bryobacteraceae bacterium]
MCIRFRTLARSSRASGFNLFGMGFFLRELQARRPVALERRAALQSLLRLLEEHLHTSDEL